MNCDLIMTNEGKGMSEDAVGTILCVLKEIKQKYAAERMPVRLR